jgi:hypothetical protein
MAPRLGFIVNPGETNCTLSEVAHVNGNFTDPSFGVVFARWWWLGVLSLAPLERVVGPRRCDSSTPRKIARRWIAIKQLLPSCIPSGTAMSTIPTGELL